MGFLQAETAGYDRSADEAYASWSRLSRTFPPRTEDGNARQMMAEFWRNQAVRMQEVSDAFVRRFPEDGRRWELVLRAAQLQRWLEWDSETDRVASLQATLGVLQQIMAAPDAKAEIVEQANMLWLMLHLNKIEPLQGAEALLALQAIQGHLDAFMSNYPASRLTTNLERIHLNLMHPWDPEAADQRARQLAQQEQNPGLVGLAEGWLARAIYRGEVLAMNFIAADGRPVDLASMQGKVVLIDFWATWCGPCMAEMPHLKKLYEQYRDQGFEVIGISLDGGGITKGIQSGVRTKEDFLAFLEREQMPWPQHYENTGWDNRYAKELGIKSIPALFLIGRDGRVISGNLRGSHLDHMLPAALKQSAGAPALK